MIATLAVALAGGHGTGLVAWFRGNMGTNPESWNWRKFEVTLICALGVRGFAELTGHTVQQVGGELMLDANGWAVVGLVSVTNTLVATADKWLRKRRTPTAT